MFDKKQEVEKLEKTLSGYSEKESEKRKECEENIKAEKSKEEALKKQIQKMVLQKDKADYESEKQEKELR